VSNSARGRDSCDEVEVRSAEDTVPLPVSSPTAGITASILSATTLAFVGTCFHQAQSGLRNGRARLQTQEFAPGGLPFGAYVLRKMEPSLSLGKVGLSSGNSGSYSHSCGSWSRLWLLAADDNVVSPSVEDRVAAFGARDHMSCGVRKSFRPKGAHRIGSRGAPSGQETRCSRRKGHHRKCPGESQRVSRAYLIQEVAEQAR
jgi:hypothetical protein